MTHGMRPDLEVAISYGRRGESTVRLRGELDIASTARVRRLLDALLDEGARIAVDLSRLSFVDLPGVRMLVEVADHAAGRGCPLQLTGVTGQVARVFELTSARSALPLAA